MSLKQVCLVFPQDASLVPPTGTICLSHEIIPGWFFRNDQKRSFLPRATAPSRVTPRLLGEWSVNSEKAGNVGCTCGCGGGVTAGALPVRVYR